MQFVMHNNPGNIKPLLDLRLQINNKTVSVEMNLWHQQRTGFDTEKDFPKGNDELKAAIDCWNWNFSKPNKRICIYGNRSVHHCPEFT